MGGDSHLTDRGINRMEHAHRIRGLKAGDTVLLQGTGSVFIFGLQFSMNRAIAHHRLHPVIDRVFPLAQIGETIVLMAEGKQ